MLTRMERDRINKLIVDECIGKMLKVATVAGPGLCLLSYWRTWRPASSPDVALNTLIFHFQNKFSFS